MADIVQLRADVAENRLDELATIVDDGWAAVERNTEVVKAAVIEAYELLHPTNQFKAWIAERKVPKTTAYRWIGPNDVVQQRNVERPTRDVRQLETVQYDPTGDNRFEEEIPEPSQEDYKAWIEVYRSWPRHMKKSAIATLNHIYDMEINL